jgi:hypothetical protein
LFGRLLYLSSVNDIDSISVSQWTIIDLSTRRNFQLNRRKHTYAQAGPSREYFLSANRKCHYCWCNLFVAYYDINSSV